VTNEATGGREGNEECSGQTLYRLSWQTELPVSKHLDDLAMHGPAIILSILPLV